MMDDRAAGGGRKPCSLGSAISRRGLWELAAHPRRSMRKIDASCKK
jgi:hypothetical protein